MSALGPKFPEDAHWISRTDPTDPLATFSRHGFELDGEFWPSVEHYFQAMKFVDKPLRHRIRDLGHPRLAEKVARRRFWKVRKDWRKIRQVIMTRGTYMKCQVHPEVKEALLATGDRMIVENSLYDPFWGCGRDQRGHNYYGKVLMDIRKRLRQG